MSDLYDKTLLGFVIVRCPKCGVKKKYALGTDYASIAELETEMQKYLESISKVRCMECGNIVRKELQDILNKSEYDIEDILYCVGNDLSKDSDENKSSAERANKQYEILQLNGIQADKAKKIILDFVDREAI